MSIILFHAGKLPMNELEHTTGFAYPLMHLFIRSMSNIFFFLFNQITNVKLNSI